MEVLTTSSFWPTGLVDLGQTPGQVLGPWRVLEDELESDEPGKSVCGPFRVEPTPQAQPLGSKIPAL